MPLPSTIEEMQSQVLQGDLSANPYLQPHVIAGKDKELKTSAKKIIPAINELLKSVGVVSASMLGFTEETQQALNALKDELTTYMDNGLEESVRVNTENIQELKQLMEDNMNQSLSEKIEEMRLNYDTKLQELEATLIELIQEGSAGGETEPGTGGESLNLEFNREISISANSSIVTDIDFKTFDSRQIKVLLYSTDTKQYFFCEQDLTTIKSSNTSVYECWTTPLTIAMDPDNKIIFRNKTYNPMKVLYYDIVN